MKQLLIVFLSILTLAVNAQNRLTPGKNSFEKKWVKNDSYEMIWYVMKDTSKFEIGKVTTHITISKKTITAVSLINMKNMKMPWIDSTIADITTLKPIHHSSYNMQRDMVLNFGKIVTGFYNDKVKNKNTVISDTTKTDYFDSNIYPLLIGWLPLKERYKHDISIYDYNPSAKMGVIKASVNEVKSGVYKSLKSGSRNVWVVTVFDEIGNGENGVSTYYFDKKNRKLWKQEINAGGQNMMMQLKE